MTIRLIRETRQKSSCSQRPHTLDTAQDSPTDRPDHSMDQRKYYVNEKTGDSPALP
jgi:hypothetical protein